MASANIFAQFAQPVRSVADYLDQYDQQDARRENLSAQRQQNAIQALAMRRQTEADALASTERNALRQIARQYGTDEKGYVKALRGSGMPGLMTQADAIEAAGLKRRDTQSQIDERASQGAKRQQEMAKVQREAAVTQVAALNSPEEALALLKAKVDAKEVPSELAPAFESLIRTDPKWQIKLALAVGDPAKLVETLKPHIQYISNGKVQTPVDTNALSNPNGQKPIVMTTTPGEDQSSADRRASIAQSERASVRADQRAREGNEIQRQAGRSQVVETADGVMIVDKGTGLARPAATMNGQPLPPKLAEAARKQAGGIDALSSAIEDYRAQLKQWKGRDIVSPDARAAMGTKYNNMMLQAKEAYNLGVLNGPDYAILTSVVTDPATLKGAITSNSAMDTQAAELDRVMQRTRAAVTGKKVPAGKAKEVNWGDLK